MQRPDLQAIAAKWIDLFRIQDRIITVSYVPNLANPATGDTVYALLAIENEDEGRFSIFVQDPATWPADAARPPTQQTIEGAVRHECAHIRVRDFAPRNPSDADILAEERAVWAISDAFDKINEMNAPQFAAMVAYQLDRKPQTLAKVATNVRAMVAKTAATRRQTTGKATMDSLDLILAALTAALTAEDPKMAIDALIAEIKRLKGASGDAAPANVPDPNAPPMGADVGKGPPSPDKMPDAQMRAMAAEVVNIRKMGAEIKQFHGEAKAAAELLRPKAKEALVLSMRADGLTVTPHGEKLITEASTLEEAQILAKGMRAMSATPTKPPARLPADEGGLTPEQAAKYRAMVAKGNPRAESFRDESVKTNTKKGGAK